MKKTNNFLWVIGGSILQIPLIIEANKLGLKTIVSDINKNCVAKKYADKFVTLDIFDIEGHIQYLNNTDLNIVGVLAAGIDAPETMAAMNQSLNIKSVPLDIALLVKNKDMFRTKMKSLDYPTPKFKIISKHNMDDMSEILSEFKLPIIIKPTNNSASRDMKIFDSKNYELIQFIKNNLSKYPKILIEEMWSGPEQTVECLIDYNGDFHKGFITDRIFSFKNGYPIEMGLVHPSQLDIDKQNELYELAKKVANDLEINIGAIKLDTIYTNEGPRIIELTVRHSGGFDCQYLVPRSTGKNILKAAILTAIGQQFNPELLKNKLHKFGMTSSIWPTPGKITLIKGVEDARQIDGVEEIFLRYNIGDTIRPYSDCAARVIFIIVTGDSIAKVKNVLKLAKSYITIQTEDI